MVHRSHWSSSKSPMKAVLSFLNREHRKRMYCIQSNSVMVQQPCKILCKNYIKANVERFARSKVVRLWSKCPVLSLHFLPHALGWHNQQGFLCGLSSAWLYINAPDRTESSVLVCKWCWGFIALQWEVTSDVYGTAEKKKDKVINKQQAWKKRGSNILKRINYGEDINKHITEFQLYSDHSNHYKAWNRKALV